MEQYKADARGTFDVEEPEQLSRLVVDAVAEAEGVDPLELAPLYSVISPDALDSLFQPQFRMPGDPAEGQVRFSYEGYEVRVSASGSVELSED
jgi:hypothetical protein